VAVIGSGAVGVVGAIEARLILGQPTRRVAYATTAAAVTAEPAAAL
jgi:hypothetical protein